MATIRQRNGKSQVQVRVKGKRPVTGTFDTRAKAEKWAKDQEARLRAGVTVIAPVDTRLTLGEVISQRHYAPTYRTAIRHFLSDPIASLSVVLITRAHVDEWKARHSPSVKIGTLGKYVNVARMAWDYAQETLELPMSRKNPFSRVALKREKHRERRLQEGEYEAIVANCTSELRDIVDWAIETGMRRGEIAKIKLSHFKNDYKFLLISETKTDRPRTIPLSAKAQAIVKVRLAKGLLRDNRLFTSRVNTISSGFKKACALARIPDLTFHDLRHEALSRLADRGLGVYDLMTISGHSTMEQLKVYVQPDRERIYRMLNQEGIAA